MSKNLEVFLEVAIKIWRGLPLVGWHQWWCYRAPPPQEHLQLFHGEDSPKAMGLVGWSECPPIGRGPGCHQHQPTSIPQDHIPPNPSDSVDGSGAGISGGYRPLMLSSGGGSLLMWGHLGKCVLPWTEIRERWVRWGMTAGAEGDRWPSWLGGWHGRGQWSMGWACDIVALASNFA